MAKKKTKTKSKAKKNSKMKKEEALETIELTQNEGAKDLDYSDLEEGEILVEIEADQEEEASFMQASPEEQTEMSPADLEPDDEGEKEDGGGDDDEEDLDQACTFDLSQRKRVIEAVLFVSDKSVGMSTLKAAFGIDLEDGSRVVVNNKHIKEAIQALEEDYIENNRGFRLFTVDGGYQVRTADDLKPFLQNTIKARSFRLTGPSLETLAMIAYKQPCTKSQIDDIRGVDSSHLVRALMDRGMVSFAGKSELPGKPMLYKTTAKFLDIFGLRNLKELPSLSEIEALMPEGIGEEEEEKETLSDLTGKLSEQFEGEYSVSEEELGKISDQLSSISTETDFFEQEKQRQKEKKEQDKAESIKEALMVGEEVSTRDRNWLEKYEAALLAKATIETPEDASMAEDAAIEENEETAKEGEEVILNQEGELVNESAQSDEPVSAELTDGFEDILIEEEPAASADEYEVEVLVSEEGSGETIKEEPSEVSPLNENI